MNVWKDAPKEVRRSLVIGWIALVFLLVMMIGYGHLPGPTDVCGLLEDCAAKGQSE